MIDALIDNFSPTTAVAGALGATVMYIALYSLYRYLITPSFDAPLELYPGDIKGKSHFMSVHWVLKNNYARYKDKFWKLKQTYGEMIVLPPRYVNELRNLPEEVLSFREDINDRFAGDITGLSATAYGGDEHTSIKSIGHDLTRNLSGVMPDIWDETVFAFNSHVGNSKEWKDLNVYQFTTQIVALISGRVFAGPELNRNPDYLKAIINYTMYVFTAAMAVRRYPWFLQRLAARWLIPQMQAVRQAHVDMDRILAPVLETRRAQMAEGKAPENMTTWNLRNSPPAERTNVRIQSHLQLATSMAAIHTTSMQSSHAIFDLAARPEYIEPLREEIEEVVNETEGHMLDKRSMPKLRKLDSFLKESQRLNPLGMITFGRKARRDITLHDGTVLPKGAHVGIPAGSLATDPDKFDDPETFDGFRFAKLRESPGCGSKYQFVETGVGQRDMVSFGHGTHACPGRFFAGNEIKVILAYLIKNYDFKLAKGQGRPKNIFTDGGMRPDTSVSILLKKRTAV